MSRSECQNKTVGPLELLPQIPHPPVGASVTQQRIVAAALDDPASLEHQDLIDTL